MSWSGIPELKESYRRLGARRFWIIIICTIGFIFGITALDLWLESKVGWPERYGSSCHGRGCWIDDIWHSPALLNHPNGYQLSLFLLIWSFPTFIAGCLMFAAFKRQRSDLDL